MQTTLFRNGRLPASLLAAATVTFLAGNIMATSGVAEESHPQPSGYVPSISDMMIATIQPRHERLWRAAKESNWDFAAYELGNLRGAFGRLGRAHPMHDGIAFPDMIETVTKDPLDELDRAVRARDATTFSKGYSDLTDACNSCHQALNHGVVAIGIPGAQSSDLNISNKPAP